MRDPYFYVRGDEEVLLRVRPPAAQALLLFLRVAAVAAVVAAAGMAALAIARDPPVEPRVFLAGVAVATLVALLVAWRRWATTEYALTDARVYARRGRMLTNVHFTTHDKVTDLQLQQGPLERLLGLSGITFSTAGGDVRVGGIADALAFKERAETARDAFIRQLLEEADVELPAPADAAAARPAEATARPRADLPPVPEWTGPRPEYVKAGDRPVWHARASPVAAASSLKRLAGLAFLLLIRPERIPWLALPVLALGIALLTLGVRATQLRRMEYLATDHRVYARKGVVGTTVNQLTYDKITDITYRQDFFGRLLGYGSVTLNTAGSAAAPITMEGLADPLGAKEAIEAWRDRALGEAEA